MGVEEPRMRLEDMVHDLRTPLAIAKGSLETVIKHWEKLSEAKRLELVSRALLASHEMEFATDRVGAQVADPARSAGPRRPELIDLTIEQDDRTNQASVTLRMSGKDLSGTSARSEARGDAGLASRATLRALDPLLKDAAVHLEEAGVLQIGEAPFAVVRIRREDEVLIGSAMIESDLHMAMARATLDALNRYVTRPRRRVAV